MRLRFAPALILALLLPAGPLSAQEARILPLGDPVYRQAEELFLNARLVPPLEDTPVVVEELRERLQQLRERALDPQLSRQAGALSESLVLPQQPVSPILELGFSSFYEGDPDLEHFIPAMEFDGETFTKPGKAERHLDFGSLYTLSEVPSLVKTGLQFQVGGWALLAQPELRLPLSSLLRYPTGTNLPVAPIRADTNFPYRGIASSWGRFWELRFGRDKLQLGPGRLGSLGLSGRVPYYDYAKARLHLPWVSYSAYLVRLNPIMTKEESDYLDAIYAGVISNPEDNTGYEKIRKDKTKHLAASKLEFRPWDWLTLTITQFNLIGGRYPQFIDFNPLIIFHNTYEEGMYGVPLDLTFTAVPLAGLKLYGEFYLYDVQSSEEVGSSGNPAAAAYQIGLTALSDPYFRLGPGRFRLDCEFNLVDPWVYGKYNDLRKFTSRIVYVEPYEGRFWVDYPLGFYLGPDALALSLELSYGRPGEWEASLSWLREGKGAVDLYGYGEDSDFSHQEDFHRQGLLTHNDKEGLEVQWSDTVKLAGYLLPRKNLTLSAWASLTWVRNHFGEPGDDQLYPRLGLSAVWKLF